LPNWNGTPHLPGEQGEPFADVRPRAKSRVEFVSRRLILPGNPTEILHTHLFRVTAFSTPNRRAGFRRRMRLERRVSRRVADCHDTRSGRQDPGHRSEISFLASGRPSHGLRYRFGGWISYNRSPPTTVRGSWQEGSEITVADTIGTELACAYLRASIVTAMEVLRSSVRRGTATASWRMMLKGVRRMNHWDLIDTKGLSSAPPCAVTARRRWPRQLIHLGPLRSKLETQA
jgi:hypothetical protein